MSCTSFGMTASTALSRGTDSGLKQILHHLYIAKTSHSLKIFGNIDLTLFPFVSKHYFVIPADISKPPPALYTALTSQKNCLKHMRPRLRRLICFTNDRLKKAFTEHKLHLCRLRNTCTTTRSCSTRWRRGRKSGTSSWNWRGRQRWDYVKF